jgi:citronellol/citronellal dehydrogenase
MERIRRINTTLNQAGPILQKTQSSLKDKVVVITGGSRGIGLAIAKRAAKDGARVAILAKSTEEQSGLPGTIFSAVKEINEAGGQGLPIKCDIRNEQEITSAISLVVEKFGGIDILINNASAISIGGTEDTSSKKFL